MIKGEGYSNPTPIQAGSIPAILAGRDLLGCAQTGTGKTAAFALPMLDLLHQAAGNGRTRGKRRPRALVLSPTRELAGQIEESMRTYGGHTQLRHTVIYGGVNQFRQVKKLQSGVDVIVATPGRFLDLFEQGHIDLGAIEIFVLDEADRMLDMGFIDPIRKVAGMLPKDRQTLMFSATMPRNIEKLAESLLNNPERVSVTPDVTTAPAIDQGVYLVAMDDKPALLRHLLEDETLERAVVFTRTKRGAEKLTKNLCAAGVQAGAIHGNKSQNQRQRVLDAFRAGRCRVLVATDVAARGLDVDGVSHVFNFSLPDEPESYVHRIGRTGRAGATGVAITLCSREEFGILRTIERLVGEPIEVLTIPEETGIEPQRMPERSSNKGTGRRPSGQAQRGSRGGPRKNARTGTRNGPRSAPRDGSNSARPARRKGKPSRTGGQSSQAGKPTGRSSSTKPGQRRSKKSGGSRRGGSGVKPTHTG